MNIFDLKLFLHLAKSCRFGSSAKVTHVRPSTLSRQIQRLEEDVRQTLFYAITHYTVARRRPVTKRVRAANPAAIPITSPPPRSTRSFAQQRLRLFCSITAAYSHLPPILDLFRSGHLLVEIKLTTGDATNALDKVEFGEVDLDITDHPETLPASIDFSPIGAIPMIFIASAH